MKKLVFYRCDICGNLICMIEDSGMTPHCCGQKMTLLIPQTEDTAWEKHLPVISVQGNRISAVVGRLPHPMTKEHHIRRIIITTDRGTYIRELTPDEPPEFIMELQPDETPGPVYEFCNLHGLWCTDPSACCHPEKPDCKTER